MRSKCVNAGLTLVEMLLVMAVVAVLAAIFWTGLGPAQKMARVSTCSSHLRQLGQAYAMYRADWEKYPNPSAFATSSYVRDARNLACPEDTTLMTEGAISSYRFRDTVPPHFAPLSEEQEVAPSMVLAVCRNHLGQRVVILKGDNSELTPPTYPFHVVLRADGSVDRIPMEQVKQLVLPGDSPTLMPLYPGEPGYPEVRS